MWRIPASVITEDNKRILIVVITTLGNDDKGIWHHIFIWRSKYLILIMSLQVYIPHHVY